MIEFREDADHKLDLVWTIDGKVRSCIPVESEDVAVMHYQLESYVNHGTLQREERG